jgi:hypothetical protein
VYTPKDAAIVTPNSDTPYSFAGLDLRAEPFVFCHPAIAKERYFSVQMVDMYTANFGYAGSRTTGNAAACFAIAGPGWKGATPPGVAKVFRSETEFATMIVRTQLFDAADIENVKKVQAGYRGVPLSKFLGKPAPPAAPVVAWPKIDKALATADPFHYLNFILSFCPPTGTAAVEKNLRARFAKIGVEAGKPFALLEVPLEERASIQAGMAAGMEKIKKSVAAFGKEVNGWRIPTSAFGDRQTLAGDWATRAGAALTGIYGNTAAEAVYPLLLHDADGQKPDCTSNRYSMTFRAGQLPPANAFWSITMYDAKTQLLVANPIDRYLVNSPMLPQMHKNADGSLTLWIQKDPPGPDKDANWLPAPAGPVFVVMRVYWPKPEATNGTWTPPAVVRVKE